MGVYIPDYILATVLIFVSDLDSKWSGLPSYLRLPTLPQKQGQDSDHCGNCE